jgi:hypothetical protein
MKELILMIEVYVVFTTFIAIVLVVGERYVKRNPKTLFSKWWRREIVTKENK